MIFAVQPPDDNGTAAASGRDACPPLPHANDWSGAPPVELAIVGPQVHCVNSNAKVVPDQTARVEPPASHFTTAHARRKS